MPTIYLLAK